MNNKSALRAALTDFIRRRAGIMSAVVCKVNDVDAAKKTCVCAPVNGDALIPAVRLIQAQESKGFLILPKKGSFVVVSYLGDGSAYVAMFSDVDEVQLDGDKFGGLIKIQELKTQLDKMNAQLKAVTDSLGQWIPVANDGGAALQAFFNTAFIGKAAASFNDIENTKVKHGDGT